MRIDELDNTIEKLKDLEEVEDALESSTEIMIEDKNGRKFYLSKMLGDLVTKLKPSIQSGVDLVRDEYREQIEGEINE